MHYPNKNIIRIICKCAFSPDVTHTADVENAADVEKAEKMLLKLNSLVKKETILWVAFQSNTLRDYGLGASKDKILTLKDKLKHLFYFPTLKHNMRNSQQIVKATEEAKTQFPRFDAIPPATVPCMLNSASPVIIPLDINNVPLCFGSAISHATHRWLRREQKETGRCAASIVIIFERDQGIQSKQIINALQNEGFASNENIIQYDPESTSQIDSTLTEERVKYFLKGRNGIFVTPAECFVGMEAESMIYIWDNSYISRDIRCSMMRAVSNLIIIKIFTGVNDTFDLPFAIHDFKFLKCKKKWATHGGHNNI